MNTPTSEVLRHSEPQGLALYTGAERVELSERFYRGIFTGTLSFVGLAAIAAIALLPLRDPLGIAAGPSVILTACLAIVSPLAVRHASSVYALLRREPRWELAFVLTAAILVAYPLSSELWWPSCALLMLVATLAPFPRTLAYCLAVLSVNLLAHLLAGDLDDSPTVTITGLWVGFVFWSSTFGLSTDRLASHILRLQVVSVQAPAVPPLRVNAVQHADPDPVHGPPPPGRARPGIERLTFRQLQVVVLLADGMRYGEIAEHLSISVRQVQRHVTQAVKRLGVNNTNALVALAVREGLAPQSWTSCASQLNPDPTSET